MNDLLPQNSDFDAAGTLDKIRSACDRFTAAGSFSLPIFASMLDQTLVTIPIPESDLSTITFESYAGPPFQSYTNPIGLIDSSLYEFSIDSSLVSGLIISLESNGFRIDRNTSPHIGNGHTLLFRDHNRSKPLTFELIVGNRFLGDNHPGTPSMILRIQELKTIDLYANEVESTIQLIYDEMSSVCHIIEQYLESID